MVLERCTNAVATPFGVTGALGITELDSQWRVAMFTTTE